MEKFIEEHGGAIAYTALFLSLIGFVAAMLSYFSSF